MKSYHISLTGRGWELRKEGATRPSKVAGTKEEILELAEHFMADKIAPVEIYSADGELESVKVYLSDQSELRKSG